MWTKFFFIIISTFKLLEQKNFLKYYNEGIVTIVELPTYYSIHLIMIVLRVNNRFIYNLGAQPRIIIP